MPIPSKSSCVNHNSIRDQARPPRTWPATGSPPCVCSCSPSAHHLEQAPRTAQASRSQWTARSVRSRSSRPAANPFSVPCSSDCRTQSGFLSSSAGGGVCVFLSRLLADCVRFARRLAGQKACEWLAASEASSPYQINERRKFKTIEDSRDSADPFDSRTPFGSPRLVDPDSYVS